MTEDTIKGCIFALAVTLSSCEIIPPEERGGAETIPVTSIPSIECPECFGQNNQADFWLLRKVEVQNGSEE